MTTYKRFQLFIHKIFNWEYWPFQLVYFPIYFLWTFYAIKAKSFFFFSASNPTIKNGGFVMESKKAIYDLIPQKYYPKTTLIREGTSFSKIEKFVSEYQIQFPFIVKPDIGLRGSAVKKINSKTDLKEYATKANFDFLVQDLIPYKNEVGIFYVRYPSQNHGKITGIVSKEFLIVTGDGKSSIEELIYVDPRHALQLNKLKKDYGDQLNTILSKGEKLNLVPFGNHARGAKFVDCSHWITADLEKTIDKLCIEIPGFYFGRLDVMYNTIPELERGENFAVVELNGAASEPTHIYDPKHSLFFAWKELARHITYMFEISIENNLSGVEFLPFKTGIQELKLHWQQSKKIVNF